VETISCIFCRLESRHVVIEENGYSARKCPQCNLIYVSPRPALLELEDLYGKDHAHISAGTHIYGAFRRRMIARYMLRIIRKFIQRGRLLEIGSGSGYFLDEARKQGFDVRGIELNGILRDFTQTELGISCENNPLDESLFGGLKFDIIYHRDVISHFYDPIAEFEKINDRLIDQGLVVFETGNLGDVEPKYYKLFSAFQLPDHLFFFSEENLKQLLERTGFTLLKAYRYSIVPQLRILGGLNSIIDMIKPLNRMRSSEEQRKSTAAASGLAHAHSRSINPKQLVKNVYNCIYYVLRYQVGHVAPKKGRPQTVVFVARKTSSVRNLRP
jgi:2-polyprenyl-3-methyl-5-hydroxy-6-metoxy-1,4-benzoquinol methylase